MDFDQYLVKLVFRENNTREKTRGNDVIGETKKSCMYGKKRQGTARNNTVTNTNKAKDFISDYSSLIGGQVHRNNNTHCVDVYDIMQLARTPQPKLKTTARTRNNGASFVVTPDGR